MTDNELLEQLFRPMKEMKVADNGFSQRVVGRLPKRDVRSMSRLWTAACVVIGVMLFVAMRGWELIGYALVMLLNNPPSWQQMLTAAVSLIAVGMIAIGELLAHERYSAL
ncbi:MAG: DUF5056 domain-containing protein [Prevotella sp.]|nr:DUF5056 domain-containing protein [Prevotella sp.]